MKTYLKLARIGMNMEDATLTKWHKRPGETFQAGDVLYEIETEKISEEIEATEAGTLLEIYAAEGEDVAVGARVCAVELTNGGGS